MEILKNYDLTKLNTFGVKANAKFFVEINREEDIKEVFLSSDFQDNEKLFLGKGSNILFIKDFDGIVILNKLKGTEILKEDSENVFIKAMSGELWHNFVMFTVNNGYWGAENLSLIPGTVGASPVQNIGAYGAEVKDIIESVETYEIKTGKKKVFSNKECNFGYRESVFKNELKGKYFITNIIFKLSKKPARNAFSIADAGGENKKKIYPTLQEYLKENKLEIKTSKDISDAIVAIRKSKLPDTSILGSAGSFFKNVYVEKEKAEEIKIKYPDVPLFEEGELIKIPTGWLIEQCGWKGKKIGNVGMHEKQALVLVNYGGATGEEVKNFSDQIIASVFSEFGLKLSPEVNIV